jgi:hypothetical protein
MGDQRLRGFCGVAKQMEEEENGDERAREVLA